MKSVKRGVRIVGGFTLLASGTALLVLPGPGWAVIALGLVVLSPEFAWARTAQEHLKVAGQAAGKGGAQVWRAVIDRTRNVVRLRRPL